MSLRSDWSLGREGVVVRIYHAVLGLHVCISFLASLAEGCAAFRIGHHPSYAANDIRLMFRENLRLYA